MKDFMTIREAARALSVSEYFIRREAKAGRVPGFKSGTRVYIDVPAFRAALSRANMRDAAPES